MTIDRVGRRFLDETEALRDVSLRVGQGDFIALLGPSGCGKSTLLRVIASLDQPSSGALRWDAGAEPQPGETGFVFQDATLLPWATAAENVRLPLRLRGQAGADALVAEALARVGLDGAGTKLPRQLSGGMRMRVSIARALVSRPRLLLMDEPFAALDEITRHGLQDDLLALWSELGCSVVFVTHSIYEAAFLARRIVVMSARPGRIALEIDAALPATSPVPADRRLDPAYAALVARVTAALRAAA